MWFESGYLLNPAHVIWIRVHHCNTVLINLSFRLLQRSFSQRAYTRTFLKRIDCNATNKSSFLYFSCFSLSEKGIHMKIVQGPIAPLGPETPLSITLSVKCRIYCVVPSWFMLCLESVLTHVHISTAWFVIRFHECISLCQKGFGADANDRMLNSIPFTTDICWEVDSNGNAKDVDFVCNTCQSYQYDKPYLYHTCALLWAICIRAMPRQWLLTSCWYPGESPFHIV